MRLNSGATSQLRVTAIARPGKTFAAAISCKGGFRQDPDGSSGLHHLIEHMAFKSRDKASMNALSRRGVYVNAWTELERTTFWVSGPVSEAEEGVAFLLSLLNPAMYTRAELDAELHVLEQEQLGRQYTMMDYERDILSGQVAGAPSGWLGAVTVAKDLRKLTAARVHEVGAKVLSPANCWLTLVSPDPVAHLGAARLQGAEAIEQTEPGDIQEQEPPPLPRAVVRRFKKWPQTTLVRTFHVRPPRVYRAGPITLMCDLLGGGPHSELYRAFRETGLAYDQGLAALYLNDCAMFSVHATIDPKNTERAIHALNGVFERTRAGFAADSVEAARHSMIHSLEQLDSQIDQLCGFVTARTMYYDDRPPLLPFEVTERLRATSTENVNHVAARLTRPERCVTLVIGPVSRWRVKRTAQLAGET